MAKVGTQDKSLFYTDLAYTNPKYKSLAIWFAQSIFYAKRNSMPICDAAKLAKYRELDRGIVDENAYKKLLDPPSPMDDKSGRAEYVSADFKAYPIDQHLNNIVRGIIEKLPNLLRTRVIDPVAKRQEQKDKEKIIYAPLYRRIINTFAKEIGLPQISDVQDPYAYIENLSNKNLDKLIDTVGDPVEQIRNRIESDDELRMYMQYLYRNGIELAFDQAIQFYLLDQNKYQIRQEYFINDLLHVNCYTGRFYRDLLTGRPVLEYISPDSIRTSPFFERDGDDITYWFYEKAITIPDFERMLGAELTNEQKKQVIDLNKLWTNTGMLVANQTPEAANQIWGNLRRTNAEIKIGFFSVLTQEDTAFADYYAENYTPDFRRKSVTWDSEKPPTEDRKVYNVWYTCYYMPLPDFNGDWSHGHGRNGVITAEDWGWLSQYIYCITKETDMYRYGVDWRYSRSSLVIWRDTRMSFSDIKDRFMPKINTLWHKLQNCIVNDVTGVAFDQDLFLGMLSAVDESNTQNPKGGDALLSQMKSLRQSGMAWLKFRDKNGNLVEGVDPSKLMVPIDSKHLDKAERYLLLIMSLYNQMTQALAMSDVMQAKQPDPRTPVTGIELAFQAANNARWYIEKPVRRMAVGFAERVVRHVWNMAQEKKNYKYEKSWKEFADVVGLANAATIESITDLNPENIGMTIENEYDDQKLEIVYQMAMRKHEGGQIGVQELGLVLDTKNWRLAIMELALAEQKKAREMQAAEQANHARAMELKQMDLQIAQAMQGAKTQGKVAEIQAQGQTDSALKQQEIEGKTQSMMAQKQQLAELKQGNDANKSELKKSEELFKKYLEEQSPT